MSINRGRGLTGVEGAKISYGKKNSPREFFLRRLMPAKKARAVCRMKGVVPATQLFLFELMVFLLVFCSFLKKVCSLRFFFGYEWINDNMVGTVASS